MAGSVFSLILMKCLKVLAHSLHNNIPSHWSLRIEHYILILILILILLSISFPVKATDHCTALPRMLVSLDLSVYHWFYPFIKVECAYLDSVDKRSKSARDYLREACRPDLTLGTVYSIIPITSFLSSLEYGHCALQVEELHCSSIDHNTHCYCTLGISPFNLITNILVEEHYLQTIPTLWK